MKKFLILGLLVLVSGFYLGDVFALTESECVELTNLSEIELSYTVVNCENPFEIEVNMGQRWHAQKPDGGGGNGLPAASYSTPGTYSYSDDYWTGTITLQNPPNIEVTLENVQTSWSGSQLTVSGDIVNANNFAIKDVYVYWHITDDSGDYLSSWQRFGSGDGAAYSSEIPAQSTGTFSETMCCGNEGTVTPYIVQAFQSDGTPLIDVPVYVSESQPDPVIHPTSPCDDGCTHEGNNPDLKIFASGYIENPIDGLNTISSVWKDPEGVTVYDETLQVNSQGQFNNEFDNPMYVRDMNDSGLYTATYTYDDIILEYSWNYLSSVYESEPEWSSQSFTVPVNGDNYTINVRTQNVQVNSISPDDDFKSLQFSVDVTTSGILEVDFEREFFDSVYQGVDDDFIILVNGNTPAFSEISTSSTNRILQINLNAGSEEIEIIGSKLGDSVTETPVEEEPEPEEDNDSRILSLEFGKTSYSVNENMVFFGTQSEKQTIYVVIRDSSGNFQGMLSDPSPSHGQYSVIPRPVSNFFDSSGNYTAISFTDSEKEEDGLELKLYFNGNTVSVNPLPVTESDFDSQVTIFPADGSGAPGCEETSDGCYHPETAYVAVGGLVIFSNTDTAAHTWTSGTPVDGPDGIFDTGLMMAGGSYEYVAEEAGEFDYHCMVHPWMQGVLIVGGDPVETPNYSSNIGISASTTRLSHDNGDEITIKGQIVNYENAGHALHFTIISPENKIVQIGQVMNGVSSDGSFELDFVAGGPLWKKSGAYTVNFNYGPTKGDAIINYVGEYDEPESEPEPEPTSDSITVTTNKVYYSPGETIGISGKVAELYAGTPVSLMTVAPNGDLVSINQVTIGADKKFSTEITVGGSLMQAGGTYTVIATYGSETRSAETTFTLEGTSQSGLEIPAPFVDVTKDPWAYVDRYNEEASYKKWFDDNYPEYSSIYQAVGLPDTGYKPEPELDSDLDDEVTIVPANGSGAPGCEETFDGCYIPRIVSVSKYGTVIMKNTDTAAHTFTAGTPDEGPTGEFDTSLLMAGGSFEWSPESEGVYPYFCMVHPWMQGTILVGEGTSPPPSPEPEDHVDLEVQIEGKLFDINTMVGMDISMSGNSNSQDVAIDITDPRGTTVISRSVEVGPNDREYFEFRIDESFKQGNYKVTATTSDGKRTEKDTAHFKVKSQFNSFKIDSVSVTDQKGNSSDLETGDTGFIKVNISSSKSIATLLTVNIFDAELTSIGIGSVQTTLSSGGSEIILSFNIPDDAAIGPAEIYVNAFSDWPSEGGVPLTGEVSIVEDIE